jgi:hypothetical protein
MKLHQPARDEPVRRGGALPSWRALLAARLEPPVGAHRGEQAAACAERERPHSRGCAAPRHGEVGRRSHPGALLCERTCGRIHACVRARRMHQCTNAHGVCVAAGMRCARCTAHVRGARCVVRGARCEVPAAAAGRSPARRSRPRALAPRETTARRSSSQAAWRTAPPAPGGWRVGATLHVCMSAYLHVSS